MARSLRTPEEIERVGAAARTGSAAPNPFALVGGRLAPPRRATADDGNSMWRIAVAGLLGILIATWVAIGLALMSKPQSAREMALFDGRQLMSVQIAPSACQGRCTVRVLNRVDGQSWRVELTTPIWQRCFVVNPTAFYFNVDTGFRGAVPSTCARTA